MPRRPAPPAAPATTGSRTTAPAAVGAAVAWVAGLLAALVVAAGLAPAGAQAPPPSSTTTTRSTGPTTTGPPPTISDKPGPDGGLTIVDPRLDPDLADVVVDSPEVARAVGTYRATQQRLRQATATVEDATRQIADLTAARARLTDTITTSVRRRDKSQAQLDLLQGTLARIAVDDYVRGNTAALEDLSVDPGAATDRQGDHVVVRSVRKQQLAEVRAHRRVVDDMTAVLVDAQAELDGVVARLGTQTDRLARAQADVQREALQVVTDGRGVADARLVGDVKGQEFSLVALDAYVKAARTMATFKPECRIGWWLIAGISRTEGRHGTYGGSRLDAQGNETKPILGISLDGSGGTAVVGDTDGGAIDGDPTSDRAVGPMQFIPSTWKRWGRDGNGDGVIDAQNMYDAALAAADYLCYFGPGLDTDDGIRGAVIHYNADAAYVELVLRRARDYQTFALR